MMVKNYNVIINFILLVTIFSAYQGILGMNDPYLEEEAKPQVQGMYDTYDKEIVQPAIANGLEYIMRELQTKEGRTIIAQEINNYKNSYHFFIQKYFPSITLFDKQAEASIIEGLLILFNPQAPKNQQNIPSTQEMVQYFTPLHAIISNWQKNIDPRIKIFSLQNCYPDNKPQSCKTQFDFFEDEVLSNLRQESQFFAKKSHAKNKLILLCQPAVFEAIINYLTKKDTRNDIIEQFINQNSSNIVNLIYFSAILKHFECVENTTLNKLCTIIISRINFTFQSLQLIINGSRLGKSPEEIYAPEDVLQPKDVVQTGMPNIPEEAYINSDVYRIPSAHFPNRARVSQEKDALRWALESIQGDLLRALFQKIIEEKELKSDIDLVMKKFPSFQALFNYEKINRRISALPHKSKQLYEFLATNQLFLLELNALKKLQNAPVLLTLQPHSLQDDPLLKITSQFQDELSRINIAGEIQRNKNSHYLFIEKYFPSIHVHEEETMAGIVEQLLKATNSESQENKNIMPDKERREEYFKPLHAIVNNWKERIARNRERIRLVQGNLLLKSHIAFIFENHSPEYKPTQPACRSKYYLWEDDKRAKDLSQESSYFLNLLLQGGLVVLVCSDDVFDFIIKYLLNNDKRHSIIKDFIKRHKSKINDLIYFSGMMKEFKLRQSTEWEKLYTTIIKSEKLTPKYVNGIFRIPSPAQTKKYDHDSMVRLALEKIQTDLLRTLFQTIITQKQLNADIEKVIEQYPNFKTLFNNEAIREIIPNSNVSVYEFFLNNEPFVSELTSLTLPQKPQSSIFDWIYEKTNFVKKIITNNIKSVGIALGVISVAGIAAYKAYMRSKQRPAKPA